MLKLLDYWMWISARNRLADTERHASRALYMVLAMLVIRQWKPPLKKISPAALDARQQECTCFSGLVDDRCSFPWLRDKGSNLATSHFLARKNSRWRMANGTQTPALCWFQHQCHFFSTLWRADRADPVCKVSLEMQKWWDDLGWTQLADTRC